MELYGKAIKVLGDFMRNKACSCDCECIEQCDCGCEECDC